MNNAFIENLRADRFFQLAGTTPAPGEPGLPDAPPFVPEIPPLDPNPNPDVVVPGEGTPPPEVDVPLPPEISPDPAKPPVMPPPSLLH